MDRILAKIRCFFGFHHFPPFAKKFISVDPDDIYEGCIGYETNCLHCSQPISMKILDTKSSPDVYLDGNIREFYEMYSPTIPIEEMKSDF